MVSGETRITVIGNLTADPEVNHTQNGQPVANFTVASTNRVFDKQASEWKDGDTLFLRCAAWRDLANNVAQSLTRGTRVIATGVLKQRSYETREGEKRTVVELEVDEVGPSLLRATAQVQRVQQGDRRTQARSAPVRQQDDWTTPSPAYSDEQPF